MRDLLIFAAIIGLVWLGYRLSIVTVPLLLALMLAYLFEPVVRRLTARGLTEFEAHARIEAQMPLAEKMSRADYAVFNCGSPKLLEIQTEEVLRQIVEK